MFWIYGGSLRLGNAGQPMYDGSYFAAFEDVIVVAANYRTNGSTLPVMTYNESRLIAAQFLAFLAPQKYHSRAEI